MVMVMVIVINVRWWLADAELAHDETVEVVVDVDGDGAGDGARGHDSTVKHLSNS